MADAPHDFVEDGAPPSDFAPDDPNSEMNPHLVSSRLREIGKTIGKYDPTIPSNLPRTAPLAAGMAVAGGAAATGNPLIAAAGGAAQPYVEAGVSKALGGNPSLPTWQDAAKSAVTNFAFEAVGGAPAREGADEVGGAMRGLPPELQNVKNMRQAVRNRSFWEKMGLSPDQIDGAMANPDNALAHLRSSIDQANQVKNTYQDTVNTVRARFEGRYDSAFGEHKGAIANPKDIIDSVDQFFSKSTPHELTPGFKGFLERMQGDLEGGLPREYIDNPDLKEKLKLFGSSGKMPDLTVDELRKMRTELRENVPSNPTPLDSKAYQQVNEKINQTIDQTLRKSGASEEQIGRIHGIDADYGRFAETIKTIDPRSEKFGEQTADALFATAQQNPELGLNFVNMAKQSGKLPEFREQFLKNLIQKAGTEGGPINEMKYLRQFQETWRDSKAGEAVLNQTFGKDSPLANPVEMSKVLGAISSPETQSGLRKTINQIGNVGYIIRAGVFLGAVGGSMYSVYRHPDKAPEVIAAAGALMLAPKVLGALDSAGQRAYVRMVTNPTSVEAVKNFSRVAGASVTGLESTPQPSQE